MGDDVVGDAYQLHGCDKVCLIPRLTLSDLIHVSGLVRTVCERSGHVMVVAKREHMRSIRGLFQDLPNLRFALVTGWQELYDDSVVDDDDDDGGGGGVLDRLDRQGYRMVPLTSYRETCPYAMLGLPASLAATQFRLQRNLDVERALLDRVKRRVGTAYTVVHDDARRRIRPDMLPASLPVVRMDDPDLRTANIFDWVQVIDNAVQLHAIESCVVMMADVLDLKARKYCHTYTDSSKHARPSRYRDVIMVLG